MTTEQVKDILRNHYDRTAVCVALSEVNLSDKELDTLRLRYMRKLTQAKTAEELGDYVSENAVYNWQQEGLRKTALMWSKSPLGKILLKTLEDSRKEPLS